MTSPPKLHRYVIASNFSAIGRARKGDAERYTAKPSVEDAARFLDSCGQEYADAALEQLLHTFGRQYYEQVKAKVA